MHLPLDEGDRRPFRRFKAFAIFPHPAILLPILHKICSQQLTMALRRLEGLMESL
jgi:hypothetical protein